MTPEQRKVLKWLQISNSIQLGLIAAACLITLIGTLIVLIVT